MDTLDWTIRLTNADDEIVVEQEVTVEISGYSDAPEVEIDGVMDAHDGARWDGLLLRLAVGALTNDDRFQEVARERLPSRAWAASCNRADQMQAAE